MKTIFIIVIFIFIFRILARTFAPFLMKKAAQKMQNRMNQQQGFSQARQSRQDGDVKVEFPKGRPQDRRYKSSDDDYVDYEVID